MPFEIVVQVGQRSRLHLKAKMIKWSYIELIRAITSTFMHGFQNNLAHLFI